MPDPYDVNWRPEYTGDDSLGVVGRGEGFGANLHALWRAGRLLLPYVAEGYADAVDELHRTQGVSEHLFSLPDPYDPSRVGGREPAHELLEELRDELQTALRESAINMRDTGTALVNIANDYAATDDQAAADFAALVENDITQWREDPNPTHREDFLPRPDIADPPAPGDPPLPPPQHPPTHGPFA